MTRPAARRRSRRVRRGRPRPASCARSSQTQRRLSEAARLGFAPRHRAGVGARLRQRHPHQPRVHPAGGVAGRRPASASRRASSHPTVERRPSGRCRRAGSSTSPNMGPCRCSRAKPMPCSARWPKSPPARRLRDGLDRIVRAKMGALLVLSDDPAVLEICSGGFLLDSPFTPQRLSELAKMDGAIILNADLQPHRPRQRAPPARRLGADRRDRHPPPHRRACRPQPRRAGRQRQRGDERHQPLRRRPQAPAARGRPPARSRQPGAADARAVQGPPRRRDGRTSPRSRSKTSSPCARSPPWCSAARWCTASPTRSRR